MGHHYALWFFFSSRRRHTGWPRDWSSDVCSSDLSHQVQPVLDSHFDRAIEACDAGRLIELGPLTRLLARAAQQMADNALWTVTRAVNSRVTEFVRELVDRGRGDRALFDVLPPQRRALAER